MSDSISISGHTRLAPADLAAVGELAAQVRASGIDPRLNLEWLGRHDGPRIAGWLAQAGGRLLGTAATEAFDGTLEAALLTAPDAPDGVASALFAALLAEARRTGIQRVLLAHDRAAAHLRHLAERERLTHDHAELVMRRAASLGAPVAAITSLEVRRADDDSLALAAQVTAEDWDGDPAQALARARTNIAEYQTVYYIATFAGEPVAALNIQTLEGQPWVYGFSVLAPFRGRGFGRQTLTAALADVWQSRPGDILLEADTDNLVAISLYRSLGFAQERTFDYWAKELAGDTDS
jgi:ribosomal protein S18 acetylase RimI-like enzyme